MRGPLRALLTTCVIASVALALALGALAGAAHVLGSSVSLENTLGALPALAQRSTVYADDGKTPVATLGLEDREDVPLKDVPPLLVAAVINTEDATFKQNPGVDLASMVRALVANVVSGRVQEGGSTITQQLVKNRLLTSKRDVHRKLSELSLALQVGARYSKARILEEYLNTVYFGQGAYGVRVAADRFFPTWDKSGALRGKRLDELTLADDALLAGVISSPEGDNPFVHPDRARARRALVLERLVAHHVVTRAEADDAEAQPLPTTAPPLVLSPQNYFVQEIQQAILSDPRFGKTVEERRHLLLEGGLRIVTTLDPTAQHHAEQAVAANLPDQPPFTAALVALDPATGAVRALVGGPGYDKSQYDLVTHEPGRQAGSTYKVITLAAALEAGYSPNDTLDGSGPCTVTHPPLDPWTTDNAEPGSGVLTLREATADSVNCAFAHLIASMGPAPVADMAHRLGITQHVPAYLSITLGTNETTPLEMATVAATLADEGVHHTPFFIAKVTAPDGHVLLDNSHPDGQSVIASDLVDCETDMLRGVVTGGTGTAAAIPGVDVAGKTGTTDQKSDAWFLGYTPRLAAAVWMGAPATLTPMTNVGGITVYGGTYPARIWQAFASAELAGGLKPPFPAAGPVCDRPGAFVDDGGRNKPAPPPPVVDRPAAPAPVQAPAPVEAPPAPTAPPAPPAPKPPAPPTTVPPPPSTVPGPPGRR